MVSRWPRDSAHRTVAHATAGPSANGDPPLAAIWLAENGRWRRSGAPSWPPTRRATQMWRHRRPCGGAGGRAAPDGGFRPRLSPTTGAVAALGQQGVEGGGV